MTDSEAKTVRVAAFDGEEESFPKWWMQFQGYAGVHNFKQSLTVDADLPATAATALDPDPAKKKKQELAIRRNDIAMSHLITCLTEDKDQAMIYKAKEDPDWPNGLASTVVRLIKKKYNGSGDAATLIALKKQVKNLSMKDDEDPGNLFGKIAFIKN